MPEAIDRLKGNSVAISVDLRPRSTLMRNGLVDLHRVLVAPIALGTGRRLFDPLELELLERRGFTGGVEMLDHGPARR